jgi:hypothetical protein
MNLFAKETWDAVDLEEGVYLTHNQTFYYITLDETERKPTLFSRDANLTVGIVHRCNDYWDLVDYIELETEIPTDNWKAFS